MKLNLCSSLILASLAVLHLLSDYDQLSGIKFSRAFSRCSAENKLKSIQHHGVATSKFWLFWKIYNAVSNVRWYRVLDITDDWLEDLANEHREKDDILDAEDENDYNLTVVDLEFNDIIMSYIYMAKAIRIGKKKEILANVDEIQNIREICDNINCDIKKQEISKFRVCVPEVYIYYGNNYPPPKLFKSRLKGRVPTGVLPTLFGLQVD